MKRVLVSANNLSIGYDGKPVITGINLELQRGSITTLIGPNGAGKSTLLKTFSSQIPPTEGSILFDGCPLEELRSEERARRIAVMLTGVPETEYTSVREVVAAGRYPYIGRMGLLRREDRDAVDVAMEAVGIEDLAKEDFMKRSDGQKQRILLARAISQEPELLLLDEPTSYLDIRYKLSLCQTLRRLRDEKQMTILLSLHELPLARQISDTCVCLKEGEAPHFGTPDEVFTEDFLRKLFDVDEEDLRNAKELF